MALSNYYSPLMQTTQSPKAGERTQHTPGPWDDASNYPEYQSVRIFAGTHYIATVGNSDDPKEQTEANARLIAAAPELLEALRDCVTTQGALAERSYKFAMRRLESITSTALEAIAKAETNSETMWANLAMKRIPLERRV